jgi:hypothetical protein
MMTIPMGAHNGGVDCLIKRGDFLGGGALATWTRAFSPRNIETCDIHLRGWTLDSRTLGLRSILHGGWLWSWISILKTRIGAC